MQRTVTAMLRCHNAGWSWPSATYACCSCVASAMPFSLPQHPDTAVQPASQPGMLSCEACSPGCLLYHPAAGVNSARSALPNLARVTPLSRFAANRVLPDLPAESLRRPLEQQLEESRREAASLREQLKHCQAELEHAAARRSGVRRFGCFGF